MISNGMVRLPSTSARPHVDAQRPIPYRHSAGPRNVTTDSDFDNFTYASA